MRNSGCNRMQIGRRNGLHAALALLTTIAVMPSPALAAKRMTVEQLQQTLTAAQSAHRKDSDVVQQLADVELTARVSSQALQQLLDASPGPRTAAEVRALADTS